MYILEEKTTLDIDIMTYDEKFLNDALRLIDSNYFSSIIIKNFPDLELLKPSINKNNQKSIFYINDKYDAIDNFDNKRVPVSFCDAQNTKYSSDLIMLTISLNEIETLEEYLDKNIKILLYFNVCDNFRANDIKIAMNTLSNKYRSKNIILTNIFKSYNLIKEHPCNMYLCEGNSCHSNKNSIPSYLYMSDNGIFPYKANIAAFNVYGLDNFDNYEHVSDYFKNTYLNSNQYYSFKNTNQKIYKKYVENKVAKVLPWNLLLVDSYEH